MDDAAPRRRRCATWPASSYELILRRTANGHRHQEIVKPCLALGRHSLISWSPPDWSVVAHKRLGWSLAAQPPRMCPLLNRLGCPLSAKKKKWACTGDASTPPGLRSSSSRGSPSWKRTATLAEERARAWATRARPQAKKRLPGPSQAASFGTPCAAHTARCRPQPTSGAEKGDCTGS